jgi:C-terminal processing protease CtpA/Prc
MGNYLFERPIEFVKFAQAADRPGLFVYDEPLKIGKPNPVYYKGKMIILVNEATQSNAEFTAMGFRKAKNAIIVGSQTAGADGNVTPMFNLPGGISTVFTALGVYYPDGKETQRIGIVPDVIAKPTIKGISEGKDEVLEKALEIIAGYDQ